LVAQRRVLDGQGAVRLQGRNQGLEQDGKHESDATESRL
jgi:hypothetical protein